MRPAFKKTMRPLGINLMLITLLVSLTLPIPDSAPAPLKNLFNRIQSSAEAANLLNGKIAFETERDGNKEVYVMNPDGTNQVNLTNNPAIDVNPSWSPDGGKIAFNSDRDGNPEIYTMNANGTNVTRLTFLNLTDGGPSWSPDGTKIAFQTNRAGVNNFEIFVMNADGSNQTRLTNVAENDLHPRWSPDGTKIIFDSLRDGNAEIYTMNADGTNQVRLTNNPTSDQAPGFSPDGTKILFQRHINGTAQIVIMNADSSNLVELTTSGSNFSPTFSPAGDKIAFNKTQSGTQEVFVMDADGSDQVRLTNNTVFDGVSNWQPISKTDTIGVFRPSTGQFLLRNSNSAGAPNLTISFGQSGDQPLAGDWTGDGTDDVGVFRNGQFLLRQLKFVSSPPFIQIVTITVNFGQAGDLAVVGDWNNDGIDTPGVFRPSTNQWFLTNGPNTNNSSPPVNVRVFSFGQTGDLPIAGDWNNNGVDTIGTFTASTGTWRLRNSNSAGSPDITLNGVGVQGDLPVIGDFDGDGIDTPGGLRSSTWFLLNNFQFVALNFDFGQAGDIPVAGDWNGVNTPPDSGINDPSSGSSLVGQPQTFTTTCSDPDGWHDIATIDFRLAKSDGNGNGVPTVLWVQFDENHNLIRFYNPDLQTWQQGVPGSNVVLSSRFADLYLSGTHVQGSGPTGPSVQVTWSVVFKGDAVMNNAKQYLQITDDSGLSTGFDKVGSWSVIR